MQKMMGKMGKIDPKKMQEMMKDMEGSDMSKFKNLM